MEVTQRKIQLTLLMAPHIAIIIAISSPPHCHLNFTSSLPQLIHEHTLLSIVSGAVFTHKMNYGAGWKEEERGLALLNKSREHFPIRSIRTPQALTRWWWSSTCIASLCVWSHPPGAHNVRANSCSLADSSRQGGQMVSRPAISATSARARTLRDVSGLTPQGSVNMLSQRTNAHWAT